MVLNLSYRIKYFLQILFYQYGITLLPTDEIHQMGSAMFDAVEACGA